MRPRHALAHATEWRRTLPALVLLLAGIGVAYGRTIDAMVSIWMRSDTFAHAFLVLPIVLWLIWRKRDEVAALCPRPCHWMLLPMAVIAFVWLLGDLGETNSVAQIAVTALIVLAVPATLGLEVTRAISFPLAFLFFAVPLGEFMLPQLISWTADFTVLALRLTGIPVFREGNDFVIPSGSWSVVEACSGVRYLIASVMVGTLYAYLNYRSAKRRWVFVAFAVAVPVVANWVRAYLIVMIGHLSSNRLAAGVDHIIYGWLFFGLVVGLMYAIGTWWREPSADPERGVTTGRTAGNDSPLRVAVLWGVCTAALAIVVAPHLALWWIDERGLAAAPPRLAGLDDLGHGWQPSSDVITSWKPAFKDPAVEASSLHSSAGRTVGLHVSYYRKQDAHRKLVSSDNTMVRSGDPLWVRMEGDDSQTIEADGRVLTVRTALLRGAPYMGSRERLLRVWQLYWVDGELTSSDYRAKFGTALGRLMGRGDDAAAIFLYTDGEAPDAVALLSAFAKANLSTVVERLKATRANVGASVATTHNDMLRER